MKFNRLFTKHLYNKYLIPGSIKNAGSSLVRMNKKKAKSVFSINYIQKKRRIHIICIRLL